MAFSQEGESCGVLTIAGESEPVQFAIDGDMIHVHIRGRTRSLHYRDPLRTLACANDETDHLVARAPMPGVVVTTNVSPGQPVPAGTVLMKIESMKLETLIRSPQNGVIEQIHFQEGESFERGAALVTLSEEGR
ncbi:acetyl-CoA carboxylase biotin carboxyl carrier protein subunit [Bradyrhizobium sp. BRP22]|uniref:biotin/lipoyl-containing protein n=1 Tax=Bradyrhizobium sp. BRP22 TaxID=2793821 RepID=UPI001CD2B9DB|nr:acetyl-CoA carboxylase biotin carboxyl carrier protein subunit [Bradyrhizobium sp. BRP22]